MTTRPSFTCPDCKRTSHHPKDAEYAYCGNCHAFKCESYQYPRCMEPECPWFGNYDLSNCPDWHKLPPAWRTTDAHLDR